MNYARELPQDRKDQRFDGAPPAFVALQSQSGVPAASSVLTLTDRTTVIDITATGVAAGSAAIIGKWGSASVTASNFDIAVAAGQSRTFVVPVSVMGTTSVAGANVANGLYATLALKNVGTAGGSVLTVEY